MCSYVLAHPCLIHMVSASLWEAILRPLQIFPETCTPYSVKSDKQHPFDICYAANFCASPCPNVFYSQKWLQFGTFINLAARTGHTAKSAGWEANMLYYCFLQDWANILYLWSFRCHSDAGRTPGCWTVRHKLMKSLWQMKASCETVLWCFRKHVAASAWRSRLWLNTGCWRYHVASAWWLFFVGFILHWSVQG